MRLIILTIHMRAHHLQGLEGDSYYCYCFTFTVLLFYCFTVIVASTVASTVSY